MLWSLSFYQETAASLSFVTQPVNCALVEGVCVSRSFTIIQIQKFHFRILDYSYSNSVQMNNSCCKIHPWIKNTRLYMWPACCCQTQAGFKPWMSVTSSQIPCVSCRSGFQQRSSKLIRGFGASKSQSSIPHMTGKQPFRLTPEGSIPARVCQIPLWFAKSFDAVPVKNSSFCHISRGFRGLLVAVCVSFHPDSAHPQHRCVWTLMQLWIICFCRTTGGAAHRCIRLMRFCQNCFMTPLNLRPVSF